MSTNLLVSGAPVTVPADFAGCHITWNTFASSPVGLKYTNIRSHDSTASVKWRDMETSAGVYSFTNLDAIITAARTAGATFSFTVYQTPTFYASAGDQTHNDNYGAAGGAAFPTADTSLTGLQAFITAVITRYNTPGGAWRLANPTLGKGIQYVETWNEPNFLQNFSGFWWGTVPQLIDVCAAIYNSVKAVDPTVLVLSAGFNGSSRMEQWLQGRGSQFNVAATSVCDGLNYHTYGCAAYGLNYAGMVADCIYGFGFTEHIRLLGRQYGVPNMPLYLTEWGFATGAAQYLTDWLTIESAARRYDAVMRNMLMAAAYGVKHMNLYQQGNLCGNLTSDLLGAQKAINQMANQVCGRTIIAATADWGGPVSVTFSDGSVLKV